MNEGGQSANHASLVRCHGVAPLLGICEESWFSSPQLVEALPDIIKRYGSPVHIHEPREFQNNIAELRAIGQRLGIDLDIFFARKANKCGVYIDVCKSQNAGIDIASERELNSVVDKGIEGHQIICSAAVKSDGLIRACLENDCTIVIDNSEELKHVLALSQAVARQPNLCLRVSGFRIGSRKLYSRFGIDLDELVEFVNKFFSADKGAEMLKGFHFHLSGYSAAERFAALDQVSELLLGDLKHLKCLEYIDIGGGFPVNYLKNKMQWESFWQLLRERISNERSGSPTSSAPLLHDGVELGFCENSDSITGGARVYPFFQKQADEPWFAQIFSTKTARGDTLSDRLKSLKLRVRCEPGRWLLKNCGVTIAQVAHAKLRGSGNVDVSLFMNHTQCLTGSADYMVDPYMLAADSTHNRVLTRCEEGEKYRGYLFGSYCTETDLIIKRCLGFPFCPARGDILLFENTAGYFMHFKESESHQIPLAKNIVAINVGDLDNISFDLDAVDAALN